MKKFWLAGGFVVALAMQAPAATLTYVAALSGPNEAPPNMSPGTGFATVTLDTTAHTMRVEVDFTGLTGLTTASHIHCCTATPGTGTAGVATVTPTFTGFPGGVSSGTYDHTFDLTQGIGSPTPAWNSAFINANGGSAAGAESAFLAGVIAGRAYLNVHSSDFPGGEIRGFLVEAPEPGTFMLGGAAIGLLAFFRRRS
jgi:hypothetical protein